VKGPGFVGGGGGGGEPPLPPHKKKQEKSRLAWEMLGQAPSIGQKKTSPCGEVELDRP